MVIWLADPVIGPADLVIWLADLVRVKLRAYIRKLENPPVFFGMDDGASRSKQSASVVLE